MMRSTKQSGFTMIELMVAMVVTLVISGAIFGLLTAGNSAFRREPALSDRQQNIRMAMDMITRDVTSAGSGMATDVQVFTINDPGPAPLNNPPAGSWPSVLVPGQNADYLEMMTTDSSCPVLTACKTAGVNIDTNEPIPLTCFGGAIGNSTIAYVWGPAGSAQGAGPPGVLDLFVRGGGGGCGNGHFNAPPGQDPALNPPGGGCPGGSPSANCQHVAMMHVIRYEIAADPNNSTAAFQVPALWRSAEGRVTNGGLGPPAAPWQLVATGVEDLQVRYLTTGGGWNDSPVLVAGNNPVTWVREVQIGLSAQSIAPNLAGQTVAATGNAVRGQLISTVTPRAVLLNSDAAGAWK